MTKLTPAQQRLAEQHIGFARWIARRFWWRGDDALSDAYYGLVQAAQRFDPRAGIRFTTFAYRRIVGAIKDGERQARRDRNRDQTQRYSMHAWHEQLSRSRQRAHSDSTEPPTFAETVRDPDLTPEEATVRRDAQQELAGAVSDLSARTQCMLRQRFWYGWPQARIAIVHHLDESRVSQIITGAYRKMRNDDRAA